MPRKQEDECGCYVKQNASKFRENNKASKWNTHD